MSSAIVWFRQDLRLEDNPALRAAMTRCGGIVPVYILDDDTDGRWAPGGAARWWLHHSLAALDATLRARDSRLILARGDATQVVTALVKQTGATAVYWNRRYEPAGRACDAQLEATLGAAGVEVSSFNAALLNEPNTITTRQGRPFQVFTPFWRHCRTLPVPHPVRLGKSRLPAPDTWPPSLALDALELRPRIRWDAGLDATWIPGEAAAAQRLRQFARREMAEYAEQRNVPGVEGTSRLSAHLHFGEVGPRQVWAAVQSVAGGSGVFPPNQGASVLLAELGWREFAYHLLFHFPHTPEHPRREIFARFPWNQDPGDGNLRAWQRGRTGYPIVDAGMRQLWHCGWMHNRVRMIAGSFLVKHLRLPWTAGAAWFWDTLVDADLANNTLGWQWTAGCGADAAPFFRVFAPVLQGLKFDPEGNYVRRWIPELAALPAKYIHSPWEAPEPVLKAAGVQLGVTYPRPMVDHKAARQAALEAYRQMRAGRPKMFRIPWHCRGPDRFCDFTRSSAARRGHCGASS